MYLTGFSFRFFKQYLYFVINLKMKFFWQCMFSPRLYKIYRDGTRDIQYEPHGLEKWGDKVVVTAQTMFNISLYASPFICIYLYRKGFHSFHECAILIQIMGSIGCLLAISFLMRGIGRAIDPQYVAFLKVYNTPQTNPKVYLEKIRHYDFDFSAWPVTFRMENERTSYFSKYKNPFASSANSDLPSYQQVMLQILAFFATHSFGLKLIYPGSVGLVHTLLWTPLQNGRAQLVENHGGQRTKLGARDGNEIDTMFVDNRGAVGPKGGTLVVCCEGNSGFYEIGIMATPIKCGYSALGWNHPGFAGSTGLPFPEQEHNAIDVVMQYAIYELDFQPDHIVLFGWSIGGYTATWAAINYPVKSLVLDATFDDLLPLAENQMPRSWRRLVREVVRSHADLHVARLLARYAGHVALVRRTHDEIICLKHGQLSTNCGNFLLLKLIQSRHPEIFEGDSGQSMDLINYMSMPESQREAILKNKKEEYDLRIMALINKYMVDYKSTHCTPLPAEVFQNIMDSFPITPL